MTIYVLENSNEICQLELGYVDSLKDIPRLVDRLISYYSKDFRPLEGTLKIDLEMMEVSWKVFYDTKYSSPSFRKVYKIVPIKKLEGSDQ